jgi:hypothetical protein
MNMLHAVLTAGLRLAEALKAENEALIALDMPRAAGLANAKIAASDAFAAAFAAANRSGARVAGPARDTTAALAARLKDLGAENRRLLERAIGIQSRVIETIAGAALPKQTGPGYHALVRRPTAAPPRALALATRA